MKYSAKKLSIAALAGAAAFTGSSRSFAALSLTETKVASGITTSASATPYDVWLVNLTGFTGNDTTAGGAGQDAQVLGISGVLTDTAANIAAIGITTATGKGTTYDKYLAAGGNPQAQNGATTDTSTYFLFPSVTGTSIVESGNAGAKTGTASSLTGSWFVTPTGTSGNVGGIEPGQDPNGVVGTDPYAVNGTLAEILIPAGDSATFVGTYADYAHLAGDGVVTFTVGTAVSTGTGPTHSIISLTAGATAPAYGSQDGSIAITGKGNSSYNVTAATGFSTATTGYVSVTGFHPDTDTEIYALKLNNSAGVIAPGSPQLATIVADINGANGNTASTGVTASLVTGVFSTIFPGYDILLTSTGATPSTGGAAELGFDFSSAAEANVVDAGITVTGVAAVPEPATAAGVVLGAAGLLLGRRGKKQIAVA